jgi:asparagine synthase (glutamine-hydrolysing)
MSTIYGYTGNKGDPKAMLQKLKHWQCDREAVFQNEKITIGALELFKTPECPLIPQPYHYKDFIVVADCRLDNREELAKEFSITDLSTHSDIEYIALAYEKWGSEAPKKLIGDFCFAIWNTKKEELFAARDHFGIRTLYYSIVNGELIFSAEIKGILVYPGFKIAYNEKYIVSEFSFLIIPVAETFYENLFILPAGHSLLWKNKKLQISEYWHYGERTVKIPATVAEQEAEFNRLMYQSVRDRLRSFRKIGAESSGGLDSTGIAALAMEMLGKGKEFYSYGYGKPEVPTSDKDTKDDMHVVKEMCEKYGIDQYFTSVNEKDIKVEDIDHLLMDVCDDYESNGVPLFSSALLKHAERQGVGMLFSGWAGDQGVTCTSEGFFENLAKEKRYPELWKDIRRKHSVIKAFPRFFYYAITARKQNKFQKADRKRRKEVLANGPLNDEMVVKYNLENIATTNDFLKGCTDIQTYLVRNINYVGIQKRTCDHVLIGKHFRVDYRFPMYDLRLLEYIYSLPFTTISPKGKSRYLFKKLVQPFVPAELIATHKSFVATTPFGFRFRKELDPFMKKAYYANENPKLKAYFDFQKLEKGESEKDQNRRGKSFMKLYFFAKKMQ